MNQNGNEWATEPIVIDAFPAMNNLSDVSVLDFLGSGTACLVYSSPLEQEPLQYIDLMGSKKPHLLSAYKNNCGKEVTIEYRSSSHFYLDDLKRGRKWATKLPFPVHCISKLRTEDKIRETVFASSFTYSHGYFDHEEKEFRGFGRVEQLDTEDFAQFKLNVAKNVVEEDLHQPPVRTVSWFHTGAYVRKEKIEEQYKTEYFQNALFTEYELPAPEINATLPDNTLHVLSPAEIREAYRALKGLILRSEVYANDNSTKKDIPYSAAESAYTVRIIQPKAGNKFASFLLVPSQSISYDYDREPADPRVAHSYMLETDEMGNVLKSASVVYPRAKRPVAPQKPIPDKVWDEQNKMHIICSEGLYTKDKISDTVYRLRAGYESKSYEISGIAQPAGFYIAKQDLLAGIAACQEILFEVDFDGTRQKRLSGQSRTYFTDDLSTALPLGTLSESGMVHKTHQLAFTQNMIGKYYQTKVTDNMLTTAKYIHSEGDAHWWIQSGSVIYPANPRAAFFMPIGGRDVFGNETTVVFDKYNLLVKTSTDSLQNTFTATNDYRTLSAVMLTDPNLNRSAVEVDELGIVIKTAVMGKAGAGEGDTLADPSGFIEYDIFNWQNNSKPNYVHSRVREQHGLPTTRWQESYTYSDGAGSLIMTKLQAHPGKALRWNTVTKLVEEVDADPRWVGNGRTIHNNKGNAVKTYEPYFSTTHEYESEDALVQTGVSSLAYYDPVDRNIRTEFTNGTFSKVECTGWMYTAYDVNDTVKGSKWYIERGSPDPLLIPEPADPEQRAAWLAAKHHNTPATAYTDSLGRTVYTESYIDSNRIAGQFSLAGLSGRDSRIFDQLGRKISESAINMLGVTIYGKTAEKGERWTFTDVMGRLVKIWDNNILEFRNTYDALHRPIANFVKQNNTERLLSYVVYGELIPNAAQQNLRNRTYQMYDQSGVATVKKIDFKGNAIEAERRLTKEYKLATDWKDLEGLTDIQDIINAAEPLLEKEIFSSSSVLDALSRPILSTYPDNSIIECRYNEANQLETLKVKLRGQGNFVTFLEAQDYNAKGQRQYAKHGNGLVSRYTYDPLTYRLINMVTGKEGEGAGQARQDLHYVFDPSGNIVYQRDDAQQTHFFSNAVIKPESKYEYDAAYQLIKATGREHAGLGANEQRNNNDLPYVTQLPHINDAAAVRNYTEQYEYDDCGNFLKLTHAAPNANWATQYHYEYQDDANNKTNRLKSTNLPGDPAAGPFTGLYVYDLHGNMTSMPHLSAANSLVWNSMNQLKEVHLGGGGNAYYVYGMGGSRVRKVIERQGKRIERLYLGPVELYREYSPGKTFERSTLHIADNTGGIAQVDTKLLDTNNADPANQLNKDLIRYQYGNHLGSASLEADEAGTIISYEEYHPFGTSAYRSSKSGTDLSLKRFRFSGKERDEETDFYYFGARYYAAWLGRWISTDPAGFAGGFNLFRYCTNNPVKCRDPLGLKGENVLLNGPQELRDPARAKDAKAQIEASATAKMGGGTKKVVVDKMHFDTTKKIWIVDKWHFTKGSSTPPPPNSGGANAAGKDASSGGGNKTGTGSPTGSDNGAAGGKPGGTPGGSPSGSAAGSPGGSPAGSPGGTPGAPYNPDSAPGGKPDGVKGGGGSGKKPETWYEKTLAVIGGVFMGAIDIIGGILNSAIHPIDTVINMGKAIKKGWDEDGLLGAVNAVNPLYHALVAGYESYQAVERGDYFGAGRQGFHSAFNVAATVAVAVGGAGLAARGLGLSAEAGGLESSMLSGSRASTVEVMEGAGVKITPYTPKGTVFGQSTGYTCVAASCRMLASDIGVTLTEEQIATALGTTEDGALMSQAPAAMESLGVPGGTYAGPASVADLQAALASGRSVAVGVRVPSGIGPHAFVVDSIADGTVFIRDPLRVGAGSSFGMPLSEFTTYLGPNKIFYIK